jgi:hypothetical protein
MKSEQAECAETVIAADLRLCIYSSGAIALMVMGDGDELGRKDQCDGDRDGRPPGSSRPRS